MNKGIFQNGHKESLETKLTEKEKEILFSDFPETPEFNRATIEKYSNNKFYTSEEIEKRSKDAFSVKLYKKC